MSQTYETIIGLEIHIQIKTATKMFCGCPNAEAEEPNHHVCEICLGHPGVLPVLNEEAVKKAILMAKAIHCEIAKFTKFDRKNYFYPDLPKGYQISQFDLPIAIQGYMMVDTEKIRIHRLHLEEDAAKNVHKAGETLVDFNRSGAPLMEIVTEPDFRTPEQTKYFLQELQRIARYLGVSDANMEKGNLRCDANISLRPAGDEALYPKTEIKNLNSFRAVEQALTYEMVRQTQLWNKHQAPDHTTTRGWNEKETFEQRGKEGAADYRYFPEPDIPPLVLSEISVSLPELPAQKEARFIQEYGLASLDARVLTQDRSVADFFEKAISELGGWLRSFDPDAADEVHQKNLQKLTRAVFGHLTGGVFQYVNTHHEDFSNIKLTPENFAEFIALIHRGVMNRQSSQKVLEAMLETGKDPDDILQAGDFSQVSDVNILEQSVEQAIAQNEKAVSEYRSGKPNAIMFLVGCVMKLTKGKAEPKIVQELFKKKLEK